MNKWLSATALAAGLMLAASPAHAVYTIVMTETGGDVVATGSGSIDLSGVSLDHATLYCGFGLGFIHPRSGGFCAGYKTDTSFVSTSYPANFGTGGAAYSNHSSGQSLFLLQSRIYLPDGYVSGSAFSSTNTWNDRTLASLGVTPGTYTWTFGTGANVDSIVLKIESVAPPPPPPPPISGRITLPYVPVIDQRVSVLDMGSGNGPSMTACLLGTVKQLFGTEATYLGQSAYGATRIAVGRQTISFYPLEASTSTTLGVGAFPTSSNALDVGTHCGTFNVVPAVGSLDDLGATLTAMGLSAEIDAKGVLTANVNGSLYAIRPDYVVTQGTVSGTPSLAFDDHGVLRFTDRAGRVQILRPAFLDPSALQAALGEAIGGVLTIQYDGRGLFTRINGSQLLLDPEMALSPAPGGMGAANWLNDKTGHYLYRVATQHQGLTATAP